MEEDDLTRPINPEEYKELGILSSEMKTRKLDTDELLDALGQTSGSIDLDELLGEDNPIKEGKTIGSYKLISRLGGGGMGDVFKAENETNSQVVAVKFLKKDIFQYMPKEKCIERFMREAKVISENKHPNLVSLIDYGEVDDNYFYSMEYIEGKTLRSMMDEGHLGIRRGIKMALGIAGALDAVHSAGIIHRDVKPGNIMVRYPKTKDENFILIDCGVAKFKEDMMPGLTTEGRLLGTLEYVAPEYLRGDLDTRSDIYSLGCVLYEAFCTVTPFVQKRKEPINNFIRRIRDDEPKPVNEWNCSLAPELCAVVGKGIAKDPKKRYQNFKEFIHDLEKAEQSVYKS